MRPQRSRECRRCGKKLYTTQRQAQEVAEQATGLRGTTLRIYWCEPGRGWHLSKKEAPAWAR